MRILALDTSTLTGSAALIEDECLIAESILNVSASHSERLMIVIDELLRHAGLEINDIEGFAVAIGPGSFTGLRIGLATAKGLAASTGRGLVGVSSLRVLAYNAFGLDSIVAPVIDAKRGEVYAAAYKFGKGAADVLMEECAAEPNELCKRLLKFKGDIVMVGDGVKAYSKVWADNLGDRLMTMPFSANYPRAANVAFLAMEKFKSGNITDIASLVPNYIRKSDAERDQ